MQTSTLVGRPRSRSREGRGAGRVGFGTEPLSARFASRSVLRSERSSDTFVPWSLCDASARPTTGQVCGEVRVLASLARLRSQNQIVAFVAMCEIATAVGRRNRRGTKMSVVSERDVLRDGLRELANELDAIAASFPEGLEEMSLRLRQARTGIGLTLDEANGHRSHPQAFSITPDYPAGN